MNFVDHLKLGGKAGHNMGINMMKNIMTPSKNSRDKYQ
jgi:hypothetical protein